MPDDALPPGSTLGAFVIEERIGQGGMGAVYRARNRITGEPRALKVVRPEHAANADFLQRFQREMRLAAAVEHPNVVRVYEPSMEGDTLFLPMELIEGASLHKHLRARPPLTEREALALIVPLCDGVGALHARGIVHRDVKPQNVMLAEVPGGAVIPKVLDLGTALDLSGADEATRAGLILGTPAYMPYEQASARRDLDARTDVYALGVILYQMLTGRRPYEAESDHAMLVKVLQREPFPPLRELVPGVDRALASAVDRALAHDRERRFPDARAMADALRGVLRDSHAGDTLQPGDSSQFSVEVPPPPPPRRPRALWLALGALAVAALTVGAATALGRASARPLAAAQAAPMRAPPTQAPPAAVLAAEPVEHALPPPPAPPSPDRATPSPEPAPSATKPTDAPRRRNRPGRSRQPAPGQDPPRGRF